MPGNDERPNLWRYATAGVEFIFTFGVLLGVGLLLDRRWDCQPAFTLVGAAAGFAGGLYRLVQTGRRAARDAERRDENKE